MDTDKNVSATFVIPVPGAVRNLSGSAIGSDVTLSWDAPGYRRHADGVHGHGRRRRECLRHDGDGDRAQCRDPNTPLR